MVGLCVCVGGCSLIACPCGVPCGHREKPAGCLPTPTELLQRAPPEHHRALLTYRLLLPDSYLPPQGLQRPSDIDSPTQPYGPPLKIVTVSTHARQRFCHNQYSQLLYLASLASAETGGLFLVTETEEDFWMKTTGRSEDSPHIIMLNTGVVRKNILYVSCLPTSRCKIIREIWLALFSIC